VRQGCSYGQTRPKWMLSWDTVELDLQWTLPWETGALTVELDIQWNSPKSGRTRLTLDAFLRGGDAFAVELGLPWTLSWEAETLSRSNSTFNGRSPERRRCSYAQTQTQLAIDALLKHRNAPDSLTYVLWRALTPIIQPTPGLYWKMKALLMANSNNPRQTLGLITKRRCRDIGSITQGVNFNNW